MYVIDDHKDKVKFLLLLPDGRLASCSSDFTIKIFNPKDDYHCDVTMNHDTYVVSFDIIDNNRIVSAASFEKIYFWKYDETSSQIENSFNAPGNLGAIKTLSNNRLAVCRLADALQIWSSVPPFTLIHSFNNGSNFPVSVLQPEGKEIIIVTFRRGSLIIWDLNTYQKLYQCNSDISSSNGFILHDMNTLIFSNYPQMVSLNLTNYKATETDVKVKPDSFKGIMVKIRDEMILCKTDNKLRLYNITQKKFEDQTFDLDDVDSNMVVIDDHHIAVDGKIKNQKIILEY